MPAFSLVVCLHKERDLLERLLGKSVGVFDDLVVVHDGPEETGTPVQVAPTPRPMDYSVADTTSLRDAGYIEVGPELPGDSTAGLVHMHRGRFFLGPRAFQQEPHWPFAWAQARHDWILRLDADEFPSEELRKWLIDFRDSSDEEVESAGFTCIWPLWTGRKAVSESWPDDRIFLIHKRRVRFPAMVEQTPVPDTFFTKLPLVLHHQPKRKSYGIRNFLLRPQAYAWRRVIARSLLADANMLPRWRWTEKKWPAGWEQLRSRPLRTAVRRLLLLPVYTARTLIHHRIFRCLYSTPFAGFHHFLIGCLLFRYARKTSVSK